jgi:ectoine hydroxylase-related dioxygenase (phytanoyl-CoA dioxygenase family)
MAPGPQLLAPRGWHARPQALTTVIFIDRADATNGPLLLIPGSHRSGLIPVERSGPAASDTQRWASNFPAGVNYCILCPIRSLLNWRANME